jgi:hypothetical protein
VRAFGPPPLKQMTEDFLRAYKATIDFWVEDLKVKPLVPPDVMEVSAPGAVMHLTPGIDGIADETWRDLAARQFKGEIVVARDLLVL